MSTKPNSPTSPLVALWSLRLLRLGLESGGLSSLSAFRPRKQKPPPDIEQILDELHGKRPRLEPSRPRAPASLQVATEVASLLDLEFDASEPGALKGVRTHVDRLIRAALR